MTLVRYRTFKVWAERATDEKREIFEVTPTWRGKSWAAVLPEMRQVGFHVSDPELAARDMFKRSGWHVTSIKALD